MKWESVFNGNFTALELRDEKLGIIGFITPARPGPKPAWEVEFVVADHDLYSNEIVSGTVEEAKAKFLETAQSYLDDKIREFERLRHRLGTVEE